MGFYLVSQHDGSGSVEIVEAASLPEAIKIADGLDADADAGEARATCYFGDAGDGAPCETYADALAALQADEEAGVA